MGIEEIIFSKKEPGKIVRQPLGGGKIVLYGKHIDEGQSGRD